MRTKGFIVALVALLAFVIEPVLAQETEDEMVNKFLQTTTKKHTHKLGWFSVGAGFNRINRNNDYNKFANFQNSRFTNANWEWLNGAPIVSADFGLMLGSKTAWNLGGEYWPKFGQTLSGTYSYNSNGSTIQVTDPSSEIKVWGLYTGFQYYLVNPPSPHQFVLKTTVRAGGTVGWYNVSWDLWPEYQNLNLSTSAPTGVNTTYKDAAPALTIDLGVDYPIGIAGLALSADVDYLYLNFNQVAWYNSSDQEIVATYAQTSDSRVDLNLSGFRGKLQIKRFVSW